MPGRYKAVQNMLITDCGFRDDPYFSGAGKLVQNGPALLVNIGLDPEYKYAESEPTFNSGIIQVPALIDTGASFSAIDEDIAQSLGLPLVDRRVFYLLNGKRELNAYLAHMVVPALSWFQHGIFYGLCFAEMDRDYGAVLGRTFLRDMMLVYDGRTGSVRIARQSSDNGAGKPLEFEEQAPQAKARQPLKTALDASQPLPR